MDSTLLATKTRIPPRTHHLVPRPRLVDAIERDVVDYKLVLVSAPAGYGKTTLLTQWAHESRLPIAWLSISDEDNDVERFFRYLLTAWEAVQPDIRERPVGLLLGDLAPSTEAVLGAFIRAAEDLPEHAVFILDDYHQIDDDAIHRALTFLHDHLPPTLHLVLAGRREPPLPLARYRARRELLELHTEDLHFLEEESEEFLNSQMGLDLAHDEIASLHAQLEGWIAGLQLVSLTLKRQPEAAEHLVVSGRHRHVADYLSDEVVAQLPADRRRFLLRTSILDRLSGELCDAVTGGEHEGGHTSQAMLETLERENLFLMPLDDHREWFRYHRLFADYLREELRRRYPDEIAGLHRRAARWYLAHEWREPALRHAVAGDDAEVGHQIFDRYINEELNTGGIRAVQRWLDAIPAAWHDSYPVFDLAKAGLLLTSGDFEAGIRCVDDVERRLLQTGHDDTRWQLARVIALRCFVACFQNDLPAAEAYADQALRELRVEDFPFRTSIYHALGDTYRRNGLWEKARSSYLHVLDLERGTRSRLQSAHVYGALADLEVMQGRLRTAANSWRKALSIIEERESWGRLPLPVTGWVYLRMGELLYEWNELAEARDHLSHGLVRAELGGDVPALIAGNLIAARMALTDGDIETAGASLTRARSLVEQASFPDWTSRFERCRLEFWLAQDKLGAAIEWSEAMMRDSTLEGQPEREAALLALARILIVKGDTPSRDQALALLQRLVQTAEVEGRMGVQIEALALRALALSGRGDQAGAMISLEHALRLAEPEGYMRRFVDLGLPMARLLQEARTRHVLPDYVDKLLAAYSMVATVPATIATLPEQLSQREHDVLRLIAAGLTNREIGDALFISAETVKKHTGSIYGKLAVGNRTEAAARARVLHLLD